MKNKSWLTDEEYSHIYSLVPRVTVDLVIRSPKGLLLCWRDIPPHLHTWHLPGGRIMLRETVARAAQRIAQTEAGIKIRIVRTLGYWEFPAERQGERKIHSVSIVLLADKTGTAKTKSSSKTDEFHHPPKRMHSVHQKFLKTNGIWKLLSS